MTLFNVYIIVAYAITIIIHNRRLTRIIGVNDAIYVTKYRGKKEVEEGKKKEEKIYEKRVWSRRKGWGGGEKENKFFDALWSTGRTGVTYWLFEYKQIGKIEKREWGRDGTLPFSTIVHITDVQNNYDIKCRALR